MLIFTLPSWYKSDKHPENSIFIYEQMQAIRKLGHQVVVLAVQPVSIQAMKLPNRYTKKINDNGIITYSTEISALWPSKLRGLFIQSFYKALRKMMKVAIQENGKPDILYAHFSFAAGIAATRLAKEFNFPLVVEEHYSALMEEKIDRKLVRIVTKTVKKADVFLCVSSGLKDAVQKITGGAENITVITNMIHPCFTYHEVPQRETFVFFSMGSLIPRKGFDILIKAFAEEFKEDENILLRIGGSGSEYSKLESLIDSYHFSNRIQLIGQLSREQTLKEYTNCNCFALASRAETFGLVYREALAVGRPIITTKHGGFSEDWKDEYGYEIDIDDISALRKSFRTIVSQYQKFDLRRISDDCLKECSSESVAKRIVAELEIAIRKGLAK